MKYSTFMMPLHPPGRNVTETLKEDREAILLADRLGFSEGLFIRRSLFRALVEEPSFIKVLAKKSQHF